MFPATLNNNFNAFESFSGSDYLPLWRGQKLGCCKQLNVNLKVRSQQCTSQSVLASWLFSNEQSVSVVSCLFWCWQADSSSVLLYVHRDRTRKPGGPPQISHKLQKSYRYATLKQKGEIFALYIHTRSFSGQSCLLRVGYFSQRVSFNILSRWVAANTWNMNKLGTKGSASCALPPRSFQIVLFRLHFTRV